MSFQAQLKLARLAGGYTQQEVADLMGITKSTYCGYEIGKRQPDVEKIKRLAKILKTTGDFLLETGFDEKEPPASATASAEDSKFHDITTCFYSMNEDGKDSLHRQALMHASNAEFKASKLTRAQKLAALEEYEKNPPIIAGAAAFGGDSEMIEVSAEEHARRKKLFDEFESQK